MLQPNTPPKCPNNPSKTPSMLSVIGSRSRGRKPHLIWSLLAPSTYKYASPPKFADESTPNPSIFPPHRRTHPAQAGQSRCRRSANRDAPRRPWPSPPPQARHGPRSGPPRPAPERSWPARRRLLPVAPPPPAVTHPEVATGFC